MEYETVTDWMKQTAVAGVMAAGMLFPTDADAQTPGPGTDVVDSPGGCSDEVVIDGRQISYRYTEDVAFEDYEANALLIEVETIVGDIPVTLYDIDEKESVNSFGFLSGDHVAEVMVVEYDALSWIGADAYDIDPDDDRYADSGAAVSFPLDMEDEIQELYNAALTVVAAQDEKENCVGW